MLTLWHSPGIKETGKKRLEFLLNPNPYALSERGIFQDKKARLPASRKEKLMPK
jgi:hypothetical protein